MTQEERWQANYEEVLRFLNENHRNLSKYDLNEKRLYTWMKHNRKQMNQGELNEQRRGRFIELLALCEKYRRKNQWV